MNDPFEVSVLRGKLILKQREIKLENRKLESAFRRNCEELASIEQTLKDLEPIR